MKDTPFGATLREIRERKGYAQWEIAEEISLSKRQYIKWESGEVSVPDLKRPSVLKIMRGLKKK